MNTYSAAKIAETLGTSVPRVVRAAKKLKLGRRRGHRWRFNKAELRRLTRELGYAPRVADFTHAQTRVLTTLARAPAGVLSMRMLAAQAGVALGTAYSTVEFLEESRLVLWEEVIGSARARKVLRIDSKRKFWLDVPTKTVKLTLPSVAEHERVYVRSYLRAGKKVRSHNRRRPLPEDFT